jgi:hypothetical protein
MLGKTRSVTDVAEQVPLSADDADGGFRLWISLKSVYQFH